MSRKSTRITVRLNFILYAALGLPDCIFGSAWPIIREDFSLNVELISVITSVSLLFSLLTNFLYIKFSKIEAHLFILWALLALMIGLSLVAFAPNQWIFFAAIPFIGLGQGTIDVAVNSFVASRYSSKVLNLVHAFFGFGVTVSSLLITLSIAVTQDYRLAILAVLFIQGIVLLLFFPYRYLFRRKKKNAQALRIQIKLTLKNWLFPLFSFIYAAEQAIGIFLASYLVFRNYSAGAAAFITSLFWLAIMFGRLISVRLSPFFGKKRLIQIHYILTLAGGLLFLFFPLLSALLIGYGLAPLYPIFVEMPYSYFEQTKAARIVGLNVSAATFGILVIPLCYALTLQFTGLGFIPIIVLFNLILLIGLGIFIQMSRDSSDIL